MDWDRIEGNWKQFKQKAQEKWDKLTEDDPSMGGVIGSRTRFDSATALHWSTSARRWTIGRDGSLKNVAVHPRRVSFSIKAICRSGCLGDAHTI